MKMMKLNGKIMRGSTSLLLIYSFDDDKEYYSDRNNTIHETTGEEIRLGNSVDFQIRVVLMDRTRKGSYSHIQLYLRFQSQDRERHAVHVTSKALDLNRYFRVETNLLKKQLQWHLIYDKNTIFNFDHWKFDMECTLVSNGVNEQAASQLALALLEDEDTSDVELKGSDGTVRAHGFVLAAASPVLRAAFFGDFKEGEEKRYNVPDADVAALKLLKKFAYVGCVDGEPSVLKTLFPVARRLLMPNLARPCAALLAQALAPEEMIPVLQTDLGHPEPYLAIELLSIAGPTIITKLKINADQNEPNSDDLFNKS